MRVAEKLDWKGLNASVMTVPYFESHLECGHPSSDAQKTV
jgi:hypothetical protein